jgi:hypothetical protein
MTEVDTIAKIILDGDYTDTCSCNQCGHARAKAQMIWDAMRLEVVEGKTVIKVDDRYDGSRRDTKTYKV